ncbi:hypothetical protein [Sphingomonas sp. Mn802worker]|uniref:hypothetical protein n=1 Tax=Sphingomonas sp. Mn802worker TaxID=629773 RepID=UPI00036762DF|nr:hypothetical protein [Sphingomonas sp. Mn802worker]
MKSILLAAAALIATPAIAQTTTTPADGGATMPQDQTAPPADSTTAPASDPAMSTPPSAADPTMSSQSMPTTQSSSMPAPTTGGDGTMATPAGGYQPSQPAMSGQMAPGATVRYQAAQDPNTAYPPPAPKASYPICKAGQYDGCMQASDARGSRKAPRRRR